jgi:hypothetical protein
MPYTDASTRPHYDKFPWEAKQPGDLTYVIYRPIYKMWKASPRFSTYFLFVRGLRTPMLIPIEVQKIMKGLMKNGVGSEDVFAAYDCAVEELHVRHVANYEAQKLLENGDVNTDVIADEVPVVVETTIVKEGTETK